MRWKEIEKASAITLRRAFTAMSVSVNVILSSDAAFYDRFYAANHINLCDCSPLIEGEDD